MPKATWLKRAGDPSELAMGQGSAGVRAASAGLACSKADTVIVSSKGVVLLGPAELMGKPLAVGSFKGSQGKKAGFYC
ncbi:hypothetical protein LP420_02375 [Massilia sp. B-10]|nr:hypothetical protein LP420_02375 [Massilia sp. B-10]